MATNLDERQPARRSDGDEIPAAVETAVQQAACLARFHRRPTVGSPAQVTGERRLLVAVLADAFARIIRRDRSGTHAETERRRGREAKEALEWIVSDDHSSAFSFLSICDLLGIDAAYLRWLVTRHVRQADRRRGPRRAGRRLLPSGARSRDASRRCSSSATP